MLFRSIPEGEKSWKIQLAWSEHKNKKWLAKKITDSATLPFTKDGFQPKEVFTCKAINTDGDLAIRFYSYTLGRYQWPLTEFYFAGCNNAPSVRYLDFGIGMGPLAPVLAPNGTLMKSMMLMESDKANDKTDGKLVLFSGNFPTTGQAEPVFDKAKHNIPTLNKTPGTFFLLTAHQDSQFTSQRPFFFQDDTKDRKSVV